MALFPKSNSDPNLKVYEWLALSVLFSLLAMLTLLSLRDFPPSTLARDQAHFVLDPNITVFVEGALANPGSFKLKREATYKDLLSQLTLLPEANLAKLNLKAKLRQNQTIKLPFKPYLTIKVEGAVAQPLTLQMPKGAKLEDLLDKIAFLPEANRKKLRLKQRLKNNDVIIIPSNLKK